jgi:hypothetical protein
VSSRFSLVSSRFSSHPSTTLPNTTCRPSSHGVCTVVMKNCEPLVPGPALAAQERSRIVRGWGGRSEISLRLIQGVPCVMMKRVCVCVCVCVCVDLCKD